MVILPKMSENIRQNYIDSLIEKSMFWERPLIDKFKSVVKFQLILIKTTSFYFQDIYRWNLGRIGNAGRIFAGGNMALDMNNPLRSIQPKNIKGKFHVFHPERVKIFIFKDEEHPLVRIQFISKHESDLSFFI